MRVGVVDRGPADGVHLKKAKPGQISLHTNLSLRPQGRHNGFGATHSHLAVGEVEVVAHLHRQRSSAAAAEAHDAVLAAAVRHVVDREHSLASSVRLQKVNWITSKRGGEVRVREGVLTTMSLKLSVLGLLLSALWISSLCRLIPLTFTSWTCLEA